MLLSARRKKSFKDFRAFLSGYNNKTGTLPEMFELCGKEGPTCGRIPYHIPYHKASLEGRVLIGTL